MDDKIREKILKEQERLISIQSEAHNELMQIPGVAGTSIGLKIVNGEPTDEIVIKVYVKKKKRDVDIPKTEKIPPIIKGIKTDVLEIGNIEYEEDSEEYRPICGGIQIMTEKGTSIGTLGCLAIDNVDNSIVLLSNYHVLMDHGEQVDDLVGQPSAPCDSCCCECSEIGRIVRGVRDSQVDCAIAKLTNNAQNNFQNEVYEIGPIYGTDVAVVIPPSLRGPKDIVRKRGRTTELTEGYVTSVNKSFTTIDGRSWVGQIEITPTSAFPRFSAGGDSGSVYVNSLNQIIGLHFSGNGTVSNGNPIAAVLTKLNISLPSEGTLSSIPLKANFNKTRESINEVITLIKTYTFGDKLIELVGTHRVEIMKLINGNREVKIAWNRYKGPVFVAHLMEKGKNKNYSLPHEVDGVSSQQLLLKMSSVLEKNGSSSLKLDIENYSIKALQLFQKMYKKQCQILMS